MERRESFWDNAPLHVDSPVPYSPPPTAQAGITGHDKRIDGYGGGSKRRRKEHDISVPESATLGREPSQERPKTSHLPPSLAALAIARPLDLGMENRSGPQLPGLAIRRDDDARETARPGTGEWPKRDFEGGHRDRYESLDNLGHRRLRSDDRTLLRDGAKDGSMKTAEKKEEISPASNLPRFNDLFR